MAAVLTKAAFGAALVASATAYECPMFSHCPVTTDNCTSFDQCVCDVPTYEKYEGECVPKVECPPNMIYALSDEGFCCKCDTGFIWEDDRCKMTSAPTVSPTMSPTSSPTDSPTEAPTLSPTQAPSMSPSATPTNSPTMSPTTSPTDSPTEAPTLSPTQAPSKSPSATPTNSPTTSPTDSPTEAPTLSPTQAPSKSPSATPTNSPTTSPTDSPTEAPTRSPSTQAPSKSPSATPTNSPTAAPTMTLPPATASPTSGFGGNLTCDIWGDPHVDCMNGDQFSANPQAKNNLTIMYTMEDSRFMVVGELSQRLSNDSKWETYVDTAYIYHNGQWTARIESADCKPVTPTVELRADQPDRTASQEFIWGSTEEALTVTFTCKSYGLDTFFNKMDASAEAVSMGPLQWELSQPGYGGDCLKCNYVPYEDSVGPVPRFDAQVAKAQFDGVAVRTTEVTGNGEKDRTGGATSQTLSAVMIVALSMLATLI